MKKLLLTSGLMLGLNGCATAVVTVGCSGGGLFGSPGLGGRGGCGPEVEAVGVAIAVEIDRKIIEEVSEALRAEDSWHRMHVGGVVSSAGSPVYEARAELLVDEVSLGVVRTDESGRYDLHETVGESSCSELRLVLSHPELGRTDPIRLSCEDTRIDHDFRPPQRPGQGAGRPARRAGARTTRLAELPDRAHTVLSRSVRSRRQALPW